MEWCRWELRTVWRRPSAEVPTWGTHQWLHSLRTNEYQSEESRHLSRGQPAWRTCSINTQTNIRQLQLSFFIFFTAHLTLWSHLLGTAIKPPVPDRVKPSFVIFDIRALWQSALSIRVLHSDAIRVCQRAATSASSQVNPIFRRSLLTTPPPQFALGRPGPLLYPGTCQYSACCVISSQIIHAENALSTQCYKNCLNNWNCCDTSETISHVLMDMPHTHCDNSPCQLCLTRYQSTSQRCSAKTIPEFSSHCTLA